MRLDKIKESITNILNNKTSRILIFIITIVLALILIITNRQSKQNIDPQIKSISNADYQGTKPGTTKYNDFVEKYKDEIIATKSNQGSALVEVKSSNPNYPTEAIFIDGILAYIKVVYILNDEIYVKEFTNKYGPFPQTLYGPDASVGYLMGIYPDKGLAVIYHELSETVREAWYFTPTTTQNFIKKYAADYSTNKELHQ